jgi:hypothetical protein
MVVCYIMIIMGGEQVGVIYSEFASMTFMSIPFLAALMIFNVEFKLVLKRIIKVKRRTSKLKRGSN